MLFQHFYNYGKYCINCTINVGNYTYRSNWKLAIDETFCRTLELLSIERSYASEYIFPKCCTEGYDWMGILPELIEKYK